MTSSVKSTIHNNTPDQVSRAPTRDFYELQEVEITEQDAKRDSLEKARITRSSSRNFDFLTLDSLQPSPYLETPPSCLQSCGNSVAKKLSAFFTSCGNGLSRCCQGRETRLRRDLESIMQQVENTPWNNTRQPHYVMDPLYAPFNNPETQELHSFLQTSPAEMSGLMKKKWQEFQARSLTKVNSLDLTKNVLLNDKQTIELVQKFKLLQILRFPSHKVHESIIDALFGCLHANTTRALCLGFQDAKTFTSEGFRLYLKNHTNLQGLELYNCSELTDEHLIEMTPDVKKLRYLNLELCTNLTGKGISHIVSHCENLHILILNRCKNININDHFNIAKAIGLKASGKKGRLQYLGLAGFEERQLNIDALTSYSDSCASLRGIDLSGNTLSPLVLSQISEKLPALETFYLMKVRIPKNQKEEIENASPDLFKSLMHFKNVKHLGFDEEARHIIDDEKSSSDLENMLNSLSSLEYLSFGGGNTREKIMEILKKNRALFPLLRSVNCTDEGVPLDDLKELITKEGKASFSNEGAHRLSWIGSNNKYSFLNIAFVNLAPPLLHPAYSRRLYS